MSYDKDRFKITVEFVIAAESIDDAEQIVKECVQYGIVGYVDEQNDNPVEEYDITDAEPAEIC